MLEISKLNKSYGKELILEDIDLELEEGKVYGLLGRNGVGKTTLLNLISNQIRKDSGEIKFLGEEVFENPKVLEEICLVKESGFGVEDIKVKKIFSTAKILYKDWDEEYKNFLVDKFNLNIKKNYNKLSRGNQTIVGIIIGLASKSKLTMFDEPSLGLDAAFRYEFYKLILEDIEKNPRTIVISTHLIDEVTNVFEEVIILKDRKVHMKEEVNSLMKKAYFLNGKIEDMKDIIKNKRIISKEEFGSSTILGVFDDLNENEKLLLKENNIDISKIPLQKLFVLLTEDFNVGEDI